jgi:cell division protein FtsQ
MTGVRVMNIAAMAALVAAVAILLSAGGRWVAQRPMFDFKRLELRGDLQHVTVASVRGAIAGRLKGNFFTIKLDDARHLLETVPWVAQASVRRIWPNRLQVTLREHRALGAWNDGRLLSDRGELFVANVAEAEIFGPLPAFSGPDALAADVARRFYEFSAELADLSLAIDGISVSDRRSWALQLGGPGAGTKLELGREESPGVLGQRLADVVAAYPMIVARVGGLPSRIDARYANGFAAAPPESSNEPRAR